jgi:hypothetical protein
MKAKLVRNSEEHDSIGKESSKKQGLRVFPDLSCDHRAVL